MTCSDDLFMDRWIKHMEGAAQLIEVRGSDQLTRQEGLDLFTQLRPQIVSGLVICTQHQLDCFSSKYSL
jgi:hypothetical protein